MTAPRQVRIGAHPVAVFEWQDGLYAVRDSRSEPTHDEGAGDAAVARIRASADSHYVVYKGRTNRRDVNAIPVYAAGPEGPLAVPTGRVLVRFAEGIRADDRRVDLAALGFEFERSLPYAPNAAWVTPAGGDVSLALDHLGALEAIPDVVHVEPQLLMERAARDE